MSARASPRLRL
jgi:hypothetical protein